MALSLLTSLATSRSTPRVDFVPLRPIAPLAAVAAMAVAGACVMPSPVAAQTAPPAAASAPANGAERLFDVDLPAQPLSQTLTALSRQTGVPVFAAGELVAGKNAPALRGRFTARQAIDRLIAGSALEAVRQGDALALRAASAAPDASATTLAPVRVKAAADAAPGELPKPYAGGQIARGGSVGLLGNVDVMDAPFSVQSYTSRTLRDLNARSPLDVLTLDPSFTRAIGVTEGSDQFTSRGFTQFGYASYIVNGLPGVGATQGNDADLYERIEVIRGPTALVNGGGAALNVGTTVNLVTKTAPDEPLLRFGSRIESHSLLTYQVDAGRRFGEDNAFGVRVNGVYTGGERNDDIHSSFHRRLGSIDLDYRGERLRAYLHSFALNYRTDPYGSVNPKTLDAPDPRDPPPKVIELPNNSVESTQTAVQGGFEVDLAPRTTLAVAAGYKRSHTEQPYGYLLSLDPKTGDASQVDGYYGDRGRSRAYDATLRSEVVTGPVSHHLAVNASRSLGDSAYAGLEAEAFDTNLFKPADGPMPPRVGAGPVVGRSRTDSIGAIDMLGFFDDRLMLTVGARRVRIGQDSDNDGDQVIETRYRQSKTTPGYALLWKALPELSLYGNRVEALEQGQQAPQNTGNPVDFVANPGQTFGPTQARQWEVGVKWDSGPALLTLAYFDIERPSFFTDPATRVFGPQGLQRNRGVEFEIAGEPWRGVRLLGGYSYIDARLSATGDPATDGATAIGVPKHNLALSGEWDVASLPGLTLVSRLRSRSTQEADLSGDVQGPGVTVIGAGFYWKLPFARSTIVRGFVDNATDKRYFPSFSRSRYVQAEPRTYTLAFEVAL